MPQRPLLWPFLALTLSSAPAASTAETPAAVAPAARTASLQTVYIVGSRDPDWKTYRAYLAGMRQWEQKQSLAPHAPLRFTLRPQSPQARLEGVRLRIEGEHTGIDVPLAPDGSFTLPVSQAAADDGASLQLNRKRGLYRWRPDIHSPGVPANARRLGDLRLECEVRWTVEQDDVPALMRAVFNAAGGACHSRQIQVDFLSPRAIASARLVAGPRTEPLPAERIEPGGQVYLPPVHDTSWPDDTLVEFTYATESDAPAPTASP
jgi:hypothetical protein